MRPARWPRAPALSLTARQVDVVRLMAAGETNYRIARLLGVSEATAKTHVKHVLAKLGAANRAEAVFRWLQHPQLGADTTQVLFAPQLTLVT